jgi:hypothetical protein
MYNESYKFPKRRIKSGKGRRKPGPGRPRRVERHNGGTFIFKAEIDLQVLERLRRLRIQGISNMEIVLMGIESAEKKFIAPNPPTPCAA